MNSKFLILLVGIFAIGTILVFKSSNSNIISSRNNKLQVTASFYPLYFFSSQIGGNKATVQNITPSGSEPHDYDPSSQDIARIEKGNLLVLNGGVESWGDKIKENLKDTNVKIVVAAEGLLSQNIVENGKSQTDPHVWLDPILAKKEVRKITQGFIGIDNANKVYYENNENKLDSKLDALDARYKAGLQNCKLKDIVTSHAAFGYLSTRYGLNQVPIAGLSPDAEPSSQQLADIVKFAKTHNVKYIFFESLVSPKLADTIASEVGAKTMVLDPIEGIPDNDIKQGKNYFTLMEDNLKNLQIALQCSK